MASLENGRGHSRVFLIGIGGVSCSGKTTLAKHLRDCIPRSFIIHQDDFAPPETQVPLNKEYGVPDWDDAPTAIVWPKMAKELAHVKQTGGFSDSHYSHDYKNEQEIIPVDEDALQRWKSRFQQIDEDFAQKGEKIVWALVEGFLLYYSPGVYNSLDVRIFLREPEPVVKARRLARVYHTAEGSIWQDPPGYWENITWPAYINAHKPIFEEGDVERGRPNGTVPDLFVLEGEKISMTQLFNQTCEKITSTLGTGQVVSR